MPPPVGVQPPYMGETFREWLEARVGSETGKVSRRELGRRLAARTPGDGEAESYRRSIRRILNGDQIPTQATRDSIQDALDDHTAPSADDEATQSEISRDEFSVWQRVNRKFAMRVV